MSAARPSPVWLRVLIGALLPRADREFILGDLEEEYGRIAEASGQGAALCAYLSLGLRSAAARWRAPGSSLHTTPSRAGSGSMDRLRQDVAIGVRALLRRPGFTFAVVLTLALASGVNTAMFSIVNAVLLRPLPFPAAHELVTLWQATDDAPASEGAVSDANFRDWQSSRSLSGLASYRAFAPVLTGRGEPEVLKGGRVSEDFFGVLGHPFIVGRPFTRAEISVRAPRLAVLGETFWRERLAADPSVLGSTLNLNGQSHTVVGVVSGRVRFPDAAVLWVNDGVDPERCGRGCVVLNLIGRLRPGVTLEAASLELNGIARRVAAADPGGAAGLRAHLVTLENLTVGAVRRGLFVLLGAVGLVLLIACANVANLLFASASPRRTEIAVRSSLGASRARILRQLITESVLLSAAGSLLGVLLAYWSVHALQAWVGGTVPRFQEISLDRTVLGFTLLVLVLAALLFGLAPALALAGTDPARVLTGARGQAGVSPGARLIRSTLVALQVGLAITLLLGTGLLLRTLAELRTIAPGFDARNVETFRIILPAARYPEPQQAVLFFAQLQQRLRALPGVAEASGIAGAPLDNLSYGTSFQPLDRPPGEAGEKPSASFRPTLPGYFEALRIPLLRGRSFTAADLLHGQPVAIVSKALAERIWPGQDPIGKRISLDASAGFEEDAPRTIVGVAGDVNSERITASSTGEIYLPHAQSGAGVMTFVLRLQPGSAPPLASVREIVHGMDPELPLRQAGSLDAVVHEQLRTPALYSALLAVFAGLALTLAAIGLYGVVGNQVAQRRREVGVRVAIGASARSVLALFAWQGLRPAAVGVVLGLAGAALAVNVIEQLLFNTSTLDAAVWLSVTSTVLLVVLAASVLPAWRATRIQPVEALRSE